MGNLRHMIIVLMMLGVAAGCRDSEPPAPLKDDAPDTSASARTQVEPEPREVFGLPLPPDYVDRIEISETMVTVHTRMTLEELSAFFRSRLVDYEYVEMSRRIRAVPLRPHSPSLELYNLPGRGGQVVVDYHAAPDIAAREHVEAQAIDAIAKGDPQLELAVERARKQTPQGERAPWLSALRGKRVELRTAEGELLAPGAVWGEPYTPPVGSPLYGEQNRENFGRPFGDWRMH